MAWDDTASKIWFDGNMVDWKDANIHVLSHVVHYGTSVFEGIRAYKNENGVGVFRLKEHVQRYSIPQKSTRLKFHTLRKKSKRQYLKQSA